MDDALRQDADLEALVLAKLSEYLGREVNAGELDQGYDHLGADSMDMVVLAHELERAMNIVIMPEFFIQYPTIRAALDALRAGMRSTTPTGSASSISQPLADNAVAGACP